MRLFTAIDLPPEIVDRLDSLISSLRPLARIAWSKSANLHITTKFIGEWPEERAPELARALSCIGPRVPIPISIRDLGFFPNRKAPRTFWAGVEETIALASLAREIDEALGRLGIKQETRPYSPHLTLARIKSPVGLEAFHKQVERLGDPEFGAFEADRFYLYLSKPRFRVH